MIFTVEKRLISIFAKVCTCLFANENIYMDISHLYFSENTEIIFCNK